MKLDWKLEGFAEFDAMLKEMGPKLARQVAGNALRAGARVIRDEAKLRVPVKTGALKAAIKVRTSNPQDKRKRRVNVGVFGTEGPLAHLIEFGSDPHLIRPRRKKALVDKETGEYFGVKVKHPGTPPQPFLRPAADVKAGEVLRVIGEALGDGIVKIARKQI